ncbi:MAG: hypothetical protein ABSC94_05615 [Polyangiaceae bacterium]
MRRASLVRASVRCATPLATLLIGCGLVANLNAFDSAVEGDAEAPTGTAGGGLQPKGSSSTTNASGTSRAATASDAGFSGAAGGESSGPDGGGASGSVGLLCSSSLASRVRVTDVDVGIRYAYDEVDNNGAALGLTPLVISPLPDGGSRLAFLGQGDNLVHIVTLDAADALVEGSTVDLPAYDFQDMVADANGGVLLVSRAALGSVGATHCGNIDNLCGLSTQYPTAASCYDMYLVRFDGGTETWATKMTDTNAQLPAYGTSATTGEHVTFIWSEYAHNGRIAFNGTSYGAYFGVAVTVPGQACVGPSTRTSGVNILQGDRMTIVDTSGALQTGGFGLGCSSSGYERVIWDPTASQFVPVCKNPVPTGGQSGRLAFAPAPMTIVPVDLDYADLGSVVMAGGGGYWIVSSDIRLGQPPNSAGFADVHLFHVPALAASAPDRNIILASDTQNDRAPHLVAYGSDQMVAAWEESSSTPDESQGGDLAANDPERQMVVQILDATTGAPPAGSSTLSAGPWRLSPNVLGSRYQDFRAYPDGSVAYPAPGTGATTIRILRIAACH